MIRRCPTLERAAKVCGRFLSANQDKGRLEQQISDGLYTATTMSEKEQVLSYITAHPGCTSTGVADVVYGRQKWSGWIFARRDIDTLIEEGLVEERFDQGISKFYAKEAV